MEKISKAQAKLVRSLQHKKFRDETGLFVAEGEKCIEELRKAFPLEMLVVSTEYRPAAPDSIQTDILLASQTEIAQMSSLRTPQGSLAVFKKGQRDHVQCTKEEERETLVLALDGVQDPGNLGTIIRTCDWFGVHDIFCSPDTADCYNPKVVQATMGALARVRVHYVDLPQWIEEYRIQNTEYRPIYGTLLEGRNMYDVLQRERSVSAQRERSIIVMGNEGNGISPEVRPFITHPVFIPSYSKEASERIESLNVAIATAIVLAEFRRQ